MPEFNLYAQFDENGRCTDIVMPNAIGELDSPAPIGERWHAVRWPVNPHFTGRSLVQQMLSRAFPFRVPVA